MRRVSSKVTGHAAISLQPEPYKVGCVYHWLRNMIAVSLRGNDQMRGIIGLVLTIVVIVIVLRVLGVM